MASASRELPVLLNELDARDDDEAGFDFFSSVQVNCDSRHQDDICTNAQRPFNLDLRRLATYHGLEPFEHQ